MNTRLVLLVALLATTASLCVGKGGSDDGGNGGGGSNSGKGGGGGGGGGGGDDNGKGGNGGGGGGNGSPGGPPTTITSPRPASSTTTAGGGDDGKGGASPSTTTPRPISSSSSTAAPAGNGGGAAPPSGGGQVQCTCSAINSCIQQTRQNMISCVNNCIAGTGGNLAAVQQCYAQNQAAAILDMPSCMQPFADTMCTNASGVAIASSAVQQDGMCSVMNAYAITSFNDAVNSDGSCVSQCTIAAGNPVNSCAIDGSNCPAQLGCAWSKPTQPNNQANDQAVAVCEQSWFAQIQALCDCLSAAGASPVQTPFACVQSGAGK